jgi:hypothetical protein
MVIDASIAANMPERSARVVERGRLGEIKKQA